MAADDLLDALARAGLYELLRMRLVKAVPVTQPGAGAEWSATVPAGVVWEPLFVSFVFTASAVVANRGPHLIGTAADGRVMRVPPVAAIVASSSALFNYANFGMQYGAGGVTVGLAMPLPPISIGAGGSIGSLTTSIDVGDTYTTVVLAVREWSPQQVAANAKWIGRQLPSTILLDEGGS